MACKTDGATSLGPGPIKRRGGGSKDLGTSMTRENARIGRQNNEFCLAGGARPDGLDGAAAFQQLTNRVGLRHYLKTG
jgi:hypothetical protein